MASLTEIYLHPSSTIPSVGASGAISGLMGAYLYLFPKIRLKTWVNGKIIGIPMWIYLGLWFMGQSISALMSLSSQKPYTNIAFGAHAGGFAAGYVSMWLMEKYKIVFKESL